MKRLDHDLLSDWTRVRSEEAFRALVDRYAGLVYGTALRRTKDARLAEEVMQDVFSVLARKAGRLDGRGGIGGWLFKTTVQFVGTARRSEVRRERAMREFGDLEASLRKEGGLLLQGGTAARVDEGLAALRTTDREMLVQRYYNGLTFREIAESSGRSEVACRKHARRALEKLRAILQRKGVTVSSAVLAAGLTGLLSTNAPAGAANSVVTTVLATTPAVTGAGLTAPFLSLMSTSKLTGTNVVGGILALATAGTSYVVGREQAKDANTLKAVGSNSMVGKPGALSSAGHSGRQPSSAAVGSVEAIIGKLKSTVRGKDWIRVQVLGPPIVKPLQEADMERAFAAISSEEGELRQRLAAILYARWATLNGKVAVDTALGESDKMVRGFAVQTGVRSWAAVDPEAAFAWQQELTARNDERINESTAKNLLGIIFHKWARQDVDGAWDQFESLSSDAQYANVNDLASAMEIADLREDTARRAASIADDRLRVRAAQEVGENWAPHDPRAAAEWFGTVDVVDPMKRFEIGMEIAEGWFERDMEAAATWLWPVIPEGMRDEMAGEFAESPIAEMPGAAEWFAERGYDLNELKKAN